MRIEAPNNNNIRPNVKTKNKLQEIYSLEPKQCKDPKIIDGFNSLPLKLGKVPVKRLSEGRKHAGEVTEDSKDINGAIKNSSSKKLTKLFSKNDVKNSKTKTESSEDVSDSSEVSATWNSHEMSKSCDDHELMPSLNKFTTPNLPENKEYFPIWTRSPVLVRKSENDVIKGGKSAYETLYPTEEESAPPLPPRIHQHRPLERSRALPYNSSPPEVSRKHKPTPEIPPRPKKLVNVEDTFNFDIIDVDEVADRPPQAHSTNPFLMDATKNSTNPFLADLNDSEIDFPLLNVEFKMCKVDKRPDNLELQTGDVPAPLATPEQDSSLLTSSVENLLDDVTVTVAQLNTDDSSQLDISNDKNLLTVPNSIFSPNSSSSSKTSPFSQTDISLENSIGSDSSSGISSASTVVNQVEENNNVKISGVSSDKLLDTVDGATSSKIEVPSSSRNVDQFVSLSEEASVPVRKHKPLSRQMSHPPLDSPRKPPFRRVEENRGEDLPVCPPTPTHHAKPRNVNDPGVMNPVIASSAQDCVFNNNVARTFPSTSLVDECSSGLLPLRRLSRLPSIPESSRAQRLETNCDEEPLPPCMY